MKESISKFNIMGIEFVRLDDLNELIRDMQHKTREHKEPGYLIEDEGQRISAELALNHLRAVLNRERNFDGMLAKLFKTRFEREAKEEKEREKDAAAKAQAIEDAETAIKTTQNAIDRATKLLAKVRDGDDEKPSEPDKKPSKRGRCPGRYTVWYRDDGETTQHCMGFMKFEDGMPVFTNRPCNAMWFVWKGTAEKVAEKCGEGFEVVDMFDQMTTEERLLRAIYAEDGMDGDEPEYHGDGTKAEDEDWEG